MTLHRLRIPAVVWPVISAVVLLAGLFLTSIPGYILFHSLSETFAIVIGAAVFTLAWNTRRFLSNNYLFIVGAALLAASAINVLHTLSYKGMGVFVGNDADLPTQLWIARRYLEGFALLAAPFFLNRRLNFSLVLAAFGGITALLLLSIFGGVFPAAYIEGAGLTPFKVVSEYVIAGLFLAAAYALHRHRDQFEPTVSRALIWSLIISAVAELLFTLYLGVYDMPNRLGHFLTIVSYYLVYLAIVKTGIVRPYDLLSNANAALSEREAALRTLTHRLVAVQEEERKHLSRELHDRAGQSITALKLGLSLVQRKSAAMPEVQARIDELREMTDNLMEELHELAVGLRPSSLDLYGLTPALQQYVTTFRKQNAIEVEFQVRGLDDQRLGSEVETNLYRIVQESLTNVARHAQAKRVCVTLVHKDGFVDLILEDDGCGFDVDEAMRRGRLGLLGMRERAEMLGGALKIESAPGSGSTVHVRVPAAAQDA